jgi:hypothetical protein
MLHYYDVLWLLILNKYNCEGYTWVVKREKGNKSTGVREAWLLKYLYALEILSWLTQIPLYLAIKSSDAMKVPDERRKLLSELE